ncbi:MAG: hypothetical protein WBP85_08025 [Terracidiphilus sp.]
MALTPPGDVYVGINDALFPKLLNVIQSQRPSLLNYISPYFAANPDKWCNPISQPTNGAPQFDAIPPLKYSTDPTFPGVEFAFQITDFGVGFGVDTVGLPATMLPLPGQRIVLKVSFSVRFAVPKLDVSTLTAPGTPSVQKFPLQVCDCFSGSLFATVATNIIASGPTSWITYAVDKFEIPQILPAGLSQAADLLLVLILDTQILPKLWIQLSPFVIDLSASLPATAPIKTITITPKAPVGSPNPNISADLLQARFSLEVTAP